MPWETCRRCEGTGKLPVYLSGHHLAICPVCCGEGEVLIREDDLDDRDEVDELYWPESIRWKDH